MNMRNYLLSLALWLIASAFCIANHSKQTSDKEAGVYDLIINGSGLEGYFTALEASKKGLKVLVLDKRTSPGYDIAAKRKLWLKEEGLEKWDQSMLDLFFPVEEQSENWNTRLNAPRRSKSTDELILFSGSIKKEMLRSLLSSGVEVLLMTDACGIMTDKDSRTIGVIVASKHGVFSIKCDNFIDATDNNFFTRNLFNQKYTIKDAGFVLDFEKVKENNLKEMNLSGLGLSDNKVTVHAAKKANDLYRIEFRFPVRKTIDLSAIEQQARELTSKIASNIVNADDHFANARLNYTALECSYNVEGEISSKLPISGYNYTEKKYTDLSCAVIHQIKENAKSNIAHIEEYNGTRKTEQVFYAGGQIAYKESSEMIWENGFPTRLIPFPVERLKVKPEKTSLLVVGGGTAGTMVALGASEKHTPVTVVEYFNDLGGTKTMAGVNDFYFGIKTHEFIQKLENERKDYGEAHNMSIGRSTIPRRFQYFELLKNNHVNIINGAIMCGVKVIGKRLRSVFICENGKIRELDASLTVDATGDADITYFAGEEWSIGDSRMGITQNYSHWDVAFRPKIKDYNRDYDIINSTEILESQRGLYLAHAEAHYYDFYPMQAIRESRRPSAVYNINTADILRDVRYDDIIVQARSDYDPHYFGSSELTRCGFMLPHYDNKMRVNIPYRAIVPKNIDGLLFSGKGIGQTYKALQFTRMSADVTVLGYVTGLIASGILKEGVEARNFSVKSIQEELIAMNYLPAGLNDKKQETPREIVAKLENGVDTLLIKAVLEKKSKILPLLEQSFKQNRSLTITKALAWFGNQEGNELIIDDLMKNYRKEQLQGHLNTYFEEYKPELIYWKINQSIGLLAMAGNEKSHSVINELLSEMASGGPMVVSSDAYTQGRIDLQLIPYYNRLINLCFYVERNPDKRFIAGLERLLADENICAYKTTEYDKTRWQLYSANLELFLAAASARCGSHKGLMLLVDYLDDIHSNFRSFARNELKAVTQQDFGYDITAWEQFLSGKKQFMVTPLNKQFEI